MSNFFLDGYYKTIERNILNFLRNNTELVPESILKSPRSIGDKLEEVVRDNIESLVEGIIDYQGEFERRAMADFAFGDENGNYYIVDVKTHNLETKFNMPNLSSVQRISKFYREQKNFFVVLKIDYKISGGLVVNKVEFVAIEHFNWSCLTVGALGWGQIQIANANTVTVDRLQNRKERMLHLCDYMIDSFYPKEVGKITDRIEYFKVEKSYWLEQ